MERLRICFSRKVIWTYNCWDRTLKATDFCKYHNDSGSKMVLFHKRECCLNISRLSPTVSQIEPRKKILFVWPNIPHWNGHAALSVRLAGKWLKFCISGWKIAPEGVHLKTSKEYWVEWKHFEFAISGKFYQRIPAKAAFEWLRLWNPSPLEAKADNGFTKDSVVLAFQDFN